MDAFERYVREVVSDRGERIAREEQGFRGTGRRGRPTGACVPTRQHVRRMLDFFDTHVAEGNIAGRKLPFGDIDLWCRVLAVNRPTNVSAFRYKLQKCANAVDVKGRTVQFILINSNYKNGYRPTDATRIYFRPKSAAPPLGHHSAQSPAN